MPRLLAPDVARGLALCLIAVANVMLYLHDRPYGMRQHLVEDAGPDRAVTFATVALVDARVYPLFALFLGFGIARLHAADSTALGIGKLRRRGVGLLLFGAVHGILLFSGDILGLYGLLTLALIPVLRWSPRRLVGAAGLLVVPCALIQGTTLADPGPTMQRMILWSIGIADPLGALAWRPVEWTMGMVGMLGVLPAVLIGLRAGRLDLVARPAAYRRFLGTVGVVGALIGLLGGVPAGIVAAGAWDVSAGPVAVAVSTLHVATGILAGIGYAALIALACTHPGFAASGVAAAFTAVGERSLTCYLLQSVLMVPLLAAWTLGWGGVLGSGHALLAALAVYAATALAALWMRQHRNLRPAEQLLRRFVNRRPRTLSEAPQ